jgi:hypothetical protein
LRVARTKKNGAVKKSARGHPEIKATALIFREKHSFSADF